MKDGERSYLAGLFDGEGCPSISYSRYERKGRRRLYKNHKVFFVISNEDKRVLKEALFLVGKGRIYLPRGTKTYNFTISKPVDVIETIKLIRSYVRVKGPELDNLQNAAEYILKVRGPSKRHRWTKEESKEFSKFAKINEALKGGKKRGPPRKHPMD